MSLNLSYRGRHARIDRVVVDTAATKTNLYRSKLSDAGLSLDRPHGFRAVVGVGGSESSAMYIFDEVAVEDIIGIAPFVVDLGPAHYGRDLGGLLGIDSLKPAGAVVNLRDWTIEFAAGAVQSPQ